MTLFSAKIAAARRRLSDIDGRLVHHPGKSSEPSSRARMRELPIIPADVAFASRRTDF